MTKAPSAHQPPASGLELRLKIAQALDFLYGGGGDFTETYPGPERMEVEYNDANHRYKINGEFVPSITTVLDKTLSKPALTWWGFRVGLAGISRAMAENRLNVGVVASWDWENILKPLPDHEQTIVDKNGKPKSPLEKLMIEIRHHPNAIKDDRGTVGTSIHNGAETLAITGMVPKIDGFPEADRGYVQALARWYIDHDPEFEELEVIRASWQFAYAGRFDAVIRHGAQRRRAMIDYKTSGGVYDSFDKQLSGYDLAYLECGGQPLDDHFVVHLRPDGTYEMVPVTIDHADFLVERLAMEQREDALRRIKALGRDT